MWKDAVVTQFNVLLRHLPGWTKENRENHQDIRSPGRDLNPEPPGYKAGVLTTQPRRFITKIIVNACNYVYI
jgi:hypothetical protein